MTTTKHKDDETVTNYEVSLLGFETWLSERMEHTSDLAWWDAMERYRMRIAFAVLDEFKKMCARVAK